MTGFLNAHGTNPNAFGSEFIAFPEWLGDDEPVSLDPALYWKEIDEFEGGYANDDELPVAPNYGFGNSNPDPRPRDRYDLIAKRYGVNDLIEDFADEEGAHFADMAIEAGLDPYFDVYPWTESNQEFISEVWCETRYETLPCYHDGEIGSDRFEEIERAHEHLPHFEAISIGQQHRTGDELAGDRARQPYRKGRHVLNLMKIHVRSGRKDTHRQMDHIWLAEMTDHVGWDSLADTLNALADWDSGARFIEPWFYRADYFEAQLRVYDFDALDEEFSYQLFTLEELYEAWAAQEHWEQEYLNWYLRSVPETPNHGFTGDPKEEQEPAPYRLGSHFWDFDPFDDLYDRYPEYDFWDGSWDDYVEDEPELEEDPDDFMDHYEFDDLTEEDILAMNREEIEREAAEEALAAEFDRIPMHNGIGRKTQRALVLARF